MKLHGPLLSFSAKGGLTKAISFIQKHGSTHAIKKPDHPDKNSPAQQLARTAMNEARASWSDIVINSTERAAWNRLNTYRLKKFTAYNGFLSQLIKLRQNISVPSIASSSETIAGRKQRWTMKNIPAGDTGDEAGSFQIWAGSSPTKLKFKETKPIATGSITSSAMSADDREDFALIKKDGFCRSGIEELGLGETPAVDGVPIGIVNPYAGLTIPTGWLLCDGSAVSRATYAELFTAIGIIYGVGDGSTTFNLPDLVDQFIRGGTPDGVANGDKTKLPDIAFTADNDNANHDHGATDNQSADHQHTGTSGDQSADHQHDTTTGNQSAAHTHTGTSGNQSAPHQHRGTTGNEPTTHTHTIGTNAAHGHKVYRSAYYTQSGGSKIYIVETAGIFTYTSNEDAHNHGGNTGTQNASHTHDFQSDNELNNHQHDTTTGNQSAAHTHTGTSGNQSAAHTHTTTTGNQSAGHLHNVAAANAVHGHAVSGGDAETCPKHLLMKYIIKAT